MTLASLFERERHRLWTKIGAVAEKHSALRPLLSREGDDRVGYLVETAAYGLARLRDVFTDDAPDATHAIVGTSMPESIRPTPAMTVCQWTPSYVSRGAASTLSEGQELTSVPVLGTPCKFQTLWPVTASPLTISLASIERREAGNEALRLRFAVDAGAQVQSAFPASLRVFASADDPLRSLDVVHALSTHATVAVHLLDAAGQILRTYARAPVRIHPTILGDQQPFLGGRRDAFASHSLLRTYFALPEAFAFFQVDGVRDLLVDADTTARSVELVVSFGSPLDDDARAVSFRLHCAPAANIRSVTFTPMVFRSAFAPQRMRPEGVSGTELFEIESLRIRVANGGSAYGDLRLWHHDDGRVLLPGDVVARLHRRPGPMGGESECDLELVTLGERALSQVCSVAIKATVTDGERPLRLLPGDVGSGGGAEAGAWVNITRVTPPIPVSDGRQLPWRMNAYARTTAADFATPRGLRGFLDVLDVTGRRAQSATATHGAGIERATRTGFHRTFKDQVHGGDRVDLTLQSEAFGGVGAAWTVGELLARALAERTDVLRFAQMRWVARDGTVRADYGVRQGERFPFPFG